MSTAPTVILSQRKETVKEDKGKERVRERREKRRTGAEKEMKTEKDIARNKIVKWTQKEGE